MARHIRHFHACPALYLEVCMNFENDIGRRISAPLTRIRVKRGASGSCMASNPTTGRGRLSQLEPTSHAMDLVTCVVDNFRDPYAIIGVLPDDSIEQIKEQFFVKYSVLHEALQTSSNNALVKAALDSKLSGSSLRRAATVLTSGLVHAFYLLIQRKSHPSLVRPTIAAPKAGPCIIAFSAGGLEDDDPTRLARRINRATDPLARLGVSKHASPLEVEIAYSRRSNCVRNADDSILRWSALNSKYAPLRNKAHARVELTT